MANIEYYKAFLAVATHGSISRAAEAMFLTPPALTKTIQLLERQLECQLFIRTSKGVRLTTEGEALYAVVKPSINSIVACEQKIQMFNSLSIGTVCIGVSEAAAKHFTMPAVFGKFSALYPNIKLKIKHLKFTEIRNALVLGEIDLAVMSCGPADDLSFDIIPLYSYRNIPIVGKKYRELAEKPVSIYELAKLPLVFVSSGYSIREHYEMMYARYKLPFDPHIETPTLSIQIQAVALNLGYSFVPETHIMELCKRGDIFTVNVVEESPLNKQVFLVTLKDFPQSRATKALVDVLLDAANDYSN